MITSFSNNKLALIGHWFSRILRHGGTFYHLFYSSFFCISLIAEFNQEIINKIGLRSQNLSQKNTECEYF